MTGAGVVGIKRHRSSEEKDVAKDAAVGSTGVRSRLVLAGAHPAHSLRLARSCASIDDAELRTWSCDVRSLRVVVPGRWRRASASPAPADEDADADPRYVGEWRLLIGGEGLGDDPETAAVIGTSPAPRSPRVSRAPTSPCLASTTAGSSTSPSSSRSATPRRYATCASAPPSGSKAEAMAAKAVRVVVAKAVRTAVAAATTP